MGGAGTLSWGTRWVYWSRPRGEREATGNLNRAGFNIKTLTIGAVTTPGLGPLHCALSEEGTARALWWQRCCYGDASSGLTRTLSMEKYLIRGYPGFVPKNSTAKKTNKKTHPGVLGKAEGYTQTRKQNTSSHHFWAPSGPLHSQS